MGHSLGHSILDGSHFSNPDQLIASLNGHVVDRMRESVTPFEPCEE